MTFLKIRKKVEKIDENKTDKKFIGKVILIFIFILVNFLVLYSILNSDDFFKENDRLNISVANENLNIDNIKLKEHTRYITEETLDTLHKNSKWRNNEELNKELNDVFDQNIEEIEEYTVER